MTATVIVPIKPWTMSKSRLHVGAVDRPALARAFALDVLDAVSAARRVGRVVIVSAEPELESVARDLGAVLLVDRPMPPGDRLNVAIDTGRRWAMSHRPHAPLLVVPADLPALTAAALDGAIEALGRHDVAFVPDVSGLGTTISRAADPARLRPFYGPRSAARHLEDGAVTVLDVDPVVRQDVDTSVDLSVARRLGLGAHTVDALAALAALAAGAVQH